MIGTGLPAPTKPEALRMRLIGEGGCLCCWEFAGLVVVCEVHHLTVGGKHGQVRRGHRFTVGICIWHHRGRRPSGVSLQAMAAGYGPSYAEQPVPFRRLWHDDRLLELQSARLADVASSYVIHPGRYADPVMPGGFAP